MSKGFLRGLSFGIIVLTSLFTVFLYPFNDGIVGLFDDLVVPTYSKEKEEQITISTAEYNHFKQVEKQNTELQTELKQIKGNVAGDLINETSSIDTSIIRESIKHQVEIRSGMNSPFVSRKLEELKIIDSATAFNDYLEKHNWDDLIQIDTYELDNTMTMEEIARIITKSP
jgi:hypothetical protein